MTQSATVAVPSRSDIKAAVGRLATPDVRSILADLLAGDSTAVGTLAAILERDASLPTAKATTTAHGGFTMDAKSLTKALRIVGRAVDHRATMPILSDIHLVGLGDKLTLYGTDLDRQIAVTVEAPGIETFEACTELKPLLGLLSKSAGQVDFKLDGERLNVTVGADTTGFATLPADDFPHMVIPKSPFLLDDKPIRIRGPLRELFDFVRPAISTEETRYYLNGVFLHARPGPEGQLSRLTAVATDGHRLLKTDADGGYAPFGAIIPRPAVEDIVSILKGREHDNNKIDLFGATHGRLVAGPVVETFKLIDGSFPDYERVIPDEASTWKASVPTKALLTAVEALVALSGEKTAGVRLTFVGHDTLRLNLSGSNGLMTMRSIRCKADPKLDKEEIAINGHYLASMLKTFGGESVTFGFAKRTKASAESLVGPTTPGNSPIRVTNEAEGAVGVLMPMRVS